jgi:hypothetical protein
VSSNPKWGFEFTGSVSAFRRLMHGIPRTCALGVSLQRNRRVPQMYPHDVVAAGGRCWTLMDETAAYKCEARANALDVGGRLRTSLDGSRAGFEIDRKFLSALVLQACVEANTPSNTPRHKLLWQERIRPLGGAAGRSQLRKPYRVSWTVQLRGQHERARCAAVAVAGLRNVGRLPVRFDIRCMATSMRW